MTYDITFCVSDCKNTKCERHESHLKNADGRMFYSIAYFKGTEDCPLRKKTTQNKEVNMNKDIENRFTYHAPKKEDIAKFPIIRDSAKELAYLVKELVPAGREQSLALTKLEEVVMWANAGIVRTKEEKDDD